ncbi:MAG: CBS domain-containing protein [Bdellovibrionales bacterium]|nr:CBS domain-containing protein [Bdellovibrionales bacterium]
MGPSKIHFESLTKTISEFLPKEALCVEPQSSVLDVVKAMRKKNRGCALIVEEDKLLGIFTQRDALEKVALPGVDAREIQIQYLMTLSPEVLEESDHLAFAINKMAVGNFRHVPIRKEDGSFSVVSVRDVIRSFVQK